MKGEIEMTAAVTTVENARLQVQPVGNLIDSWINFLGKCEKTRKTYETAIRQWRKYCVDNAIVNPIRRDVETFINSLKAAKKSVSTINLYSVAIRLFYRWAASENLYPNIADNFKADTKKSYKHKKSALTAEQGGNLIKSAKGERLVDKRNAAIIALTISAGLRTIELYRADVGDFEEVDGKIFLSVQGKGHDEKDDKVLVASQVYAMIQDYLKARGNVEPTAPLFTSTRRNKNGRLSTQSISKMVKRHLRSIGLDSKRYSAHSLRHSAACQMVIAGVELRQVQAVLRHRSITTTMIYLDEVDRMKNIAEQIAANAFFANV